MRRLALFVYLSIVIVGLSFAGDPQPLSFDSISATFELGDLYGTTTIRVETVKQGESGARKITALKLITKSGEFSAPSQILSKFENPTAIRLSTVEGIHASKLFIDVMSEIMPRQYAWSWVSFSEGKFEE
jgi:hypothetical protein